MVLRQVGDHLGVALAAEPVAPLAQALPQLAEVVDLAVEDGADRAVLVRDRRVALVEVDDREAVLGDHSSAFAELPHGVRASVTLAGELRVDRAACEARRPGDRSGDAAHGDNVTDEATS